MRGQGVKKSNNGTIEISGYFDGKNLVTGKGFKKWKKVTGELDFCCLKNFCHPFDLGSLKKMTSESQFASSIIVKIIFKLNVVNET